MASGITLRKAYLVTYNVLQAAGWSLVLWSIARSAIKTGSLAGAQDSAGQDVYILQFAAGLEVLHSLFGLVPSGVVTALMQWGGRSHVLFAVLMNTPEVQRSPAVFGMYAAWSLSEVIRYPQYALSLLGICPFALTWLRYTAFIVLYPIGVFYGEMHLVYLALPYIKKKKLFDNFFSRLPFDYHTFLLVLLAVYPLLWLQLYLYMWKQRNSKVGRGRDKKASSTRKKRE